jgi:hypothetical protein
MPEFKGYTEEERKRILADCARIEKAGQEQLVTTIPQAFASFIKVVEEYVGTAENTVLEAKQIKTLQTISRTFLAYMLAYNLSPEAILSAIAGDLRGIAPKVKQAFRKVTMQELGLTEDDLIVTAPGGDA